MTYKVMVFDKPINSTDAHARDCLRKAWEDYLSVSNVKPMGVAVRPVCYYKISNAVQLEKMGVPVYKVGGALAFEIWFRVRPSGYRLFRPGASKVESIHSCIENCAIAAGIQPVEVRVGSAMRYRLIDYSKSRIVRGIIVPMSWGEVQVHFDADVMKDEIWLKEDV